MRKEISFLQSRESLARPERCRGGFPSRGAGWQISEGILGSWGPRRLHVARYSCSAGSSGSERTTLNYSGAQRRPRKAAWATTRTQTQTRAGRYARDTLSAAAGAGKYSDNRRWTTWDGRGGPAGPRAGGGVSESCRRSGWHGARAP